MPLYGAALAPYTAAWPGRWRWLGAYLLIDPVYALAVNRFQEPDSGTARDRLRYYLAVGLILWTAWMALTATGVLLGGVLPTSLPLDRIAPLTFLLLLLPMDLASAPCAQMRTLRVVSLRRPGDGCCRRCGENERMAGSGSGGNSRGHVPRWRALPARPTVSAAVAASWALAGWVFGAGARRVSVRTGVTDEEALGSLPGDEFVVHPMVEWTRGVTVRAAPDRVWPWLVQMGYGRGGWYTPQWVDLFANRWVFGIRHPFPASADRLLPEHQHVAVGDLICDGPDYASYFRVLRVDPQHALVYRSIRHPRRGSPIDITDPASPQRVEQQLREAGTYIHFTWALVLIERPGYGTRLLVRTRANYSPRAIRLLTLPGGLVDATYGVAMLRAIARRAESQEPAGT